MKRKSLLVSILQILAGFAAGYAVAFLATAAVDQVTPSEIPASITQPVVSEDTSSRNETAPAPAAPQDTSDVAALQAQLAEKNARIDDLERKLAAPSHENVHPDDDTPEYREKLAADLLEVTRTKDMIQQAFKASAQMTAKELTPEGQEALNQAINKIYGWEKMEKVFTKVYTDVFSAQELNDLSEFYRSDVGVAMLRKQPEVMQKTMELVQQINVEAQPKMMAEVEAIMKKHRLKTASKPESAPAKN
jgi:hypothetical protein